MKCSGDYEILHGIVRDATRISSCFSDFHVVSRTISCSISESPLHFISFLTVWHVPQVADIPEQRLTLLSRHSNGDASHNREDDWNQRRYLFCICLKIIFSCIEFGSFDSRGWLSWKSLHWNERFMSGFCCQISGSESRHAWDPG